MSSKFLVKNDHIWNCKMEYRVNAYVMIFFAYVIGHVGHTADGFRYETRIVDASYYSERVLTVTTILIEPYAMLKSLNGTSVPIPGAPLYEGYIVDVLNHLADIIGFRYRLVPVWDGRFGYKQLDGSWNGMIGELMRHEADVAAGPMLITDQRSRVVDFTRPFMHVEATILIKKPPPGGHPEALSARDLLDNKDLNFGTLNKGMLRRAFKRSNITLFKRMWQEMKANQQYSLTTTNEDGIDKVREGNYAFIIPTPIAEYISRREPCDLLMVDSFLLKQGYGLAVPKGAAILPYLNRAVEILESDGYLRKLYEKWWIEKGNCNPVKTSSRVYSVNNSSFIFPNVILCATAAAAIWIIRHFVNQC